MWLGRIKQLATEASISTWSSLLAFVWCYHHPHCLADSALNYSRKNGFHYALDFNSQSNDTRNGTLTVWAPLDPSLHTWVCPKTGKPYKFMIFLFTENMVTIKEASCSPPHFNCFCCTTKGKLFFVFFFSEVITYSAALSVLEDWCWSLSLLSALPSNFRPSAVLCNAAMAACERLGERLASGSRVAFGSHVGCFLARHLGMNPVTQGSPLNQNKNTRNGV